jgi:hypothetical protein
MTDLGWTISEAVGQLHPPIERRELARRLAWAGVVPCGTKHGRMGRRPKSYPISEIMRVHAAWCHGRDDSVT